MFSRHGLGLVHVLEIEGEQERVVDAQEIVGEKDREDKRNKNEK